MIFSPSDDSFAWLKKPPHQAFLKLLGSQGGEGRFVGSAVRDSLLGRPIHDFDVATTATPIAVMQLLTKAGCKVLPTGLKHGTLTVHFQGTVYEVTTLRQDIQTDGRHAKVSFTKDWKEDALRRDLTMNALYLDANGRLYDYFGGQDDLAKGCVRFIGDASSRVREDFLRILRFFRFFGRYGKGDFHQESLKACLALKEGLCRLSRERVASEVKKIFQGPQLNTIVTLWVKEDILSLIGQQPASSGDMFQALYALEQKTMQEASWFVRLKTLYGPACPDFLLERALKKWWQRVDALPDVPFDDLERQFYVWWYQDGPTLAQDRLWLKLAACVAAKQMTPAKAATLLTCLAKKAKNLPKKMPLTGSDVKRSGLGDGVQVGVLLDKALYCWVESYCRLPKSDLLFLLDMRN
ncbi:MAG: CCA tRNA nucleotidyltransferase [Holosporaceae bacterium]